MFRAKRKMIAPRRDNPRNLRRTFPLWSSLIGQEQFPLLSCFHFIFVHRDYQLQFQVIFNYLHLLRQSMASMAIPRKMTPTHPMANFSLNNGIMSDWSLFSQQHNFFDTNQKHNLSIQNIQILNLPAIQNPGVEEQDDTSLLCLSTCLKLFWEILSSKTLSPFWWFSYHEALHVHVRSWVRLTEHVSHFSDGKSWNTYFRLICVHDWC